MTTDVNDFTFYSVNDEKIHTFTLHATCTQLRKTMALDKTQIK